MQESWHNGYKDKDNVRYKWSYYQNEFKVIPLSIKVLWLSLQVDLVDGPE